MKPARILLLILCCITIGCAQVPKELVGLSTSVGDDLVEIRESHIVLVDTHYEGLIKNINRFIDNVYLPYEIQQALLDEALRETILSAIETASHVDVKEDTQKNALEAIQSFHLDINKKVEDYRKHQLKPIQDHHKTVRNKINVAYEKMRYANSVVTRDLAYLVKVHDAQKQVLEQIVLGGLNTIFGKSVDISDKIHDITVKIVKVLIGGDKLEVQEEKLSQASISQAGMSQQGISEKPKASISQEGMSQQGIFEKSKASISQAGMSQQGISEKSKASISQAGMSQQGIFEKPKASISQAGMSQQGISEKPKASISQEGMSQQGISEKPKASISQEGMSQQGIFEKSKASISQEGMSQQGIFEKSKASISQEGMSQQGISEKLKASISEFEKLLEELPDPETVE